MWLLYAVVATVAVICYSEYAGIAARSGAGELGPIGYGAGILVLLLPSLADAWMLLVAMTLLAMAFALRKQELAAALPQASMTVLGVIYIFGAFRCAPLIRQASPHWLMFALMLSWIGDTGAYYAGRRWGRHKLAPRISPGKTREGAAASVATSVLAGVLYLHYLLPAVPWPAAAGLSAAVNIAGQFGDLAESAVKRGAGVKDSGSILPGHGGFLDRVDSTLFALPLVYLYLRLGS